VDGVVAATGLTAATVIGPDGRETGVAGVDPAQAVPVLRSTADTVLPRQGEIVLPYWAEDSWGVRAGDPVTLRTGDRSRPDGRLR
jgi:putative ABC transport system permease protein